MCVQVQHCICQTHIHIYEREKKMSQYVLTAVSFFDFSWFSRLSVKLANFAESIKQSRTVSQTYKELNLLTDRELNDIGIGRGDIERVIREE